MTMARLSIRIPDDQKTWLEEQAAVRGVSIGELVRVGVWLLQTQTVVEPKKTQRTRRTK
jgi:hypothetical protein